MTFSIQKTKEFVVEDKQKQSSQIGIWLFCLLVGMFSWDDSIQPI